MRWPIVTSAAWSIRAEGGCIAVRARAPRPTTIVYMGAIRHRATTSSGRKPSSPLGATPTVHLTTLSFPTTPLVLSARSATTGVWTAMTKGGTTALLAMRPPTGSTLLPAISTPTIRPPIPA
jgi:hypothetical protein